MDIGRESNSFNRKLGLPKLFLLLGIFAATVYSLPIMAGASEPDPIVGVTAVGGTGGIWSVSSKGVIHTQNGAASLGDLSHAKLNQPIVAIASTPDGKGYWLVASDGGVFTFGSAKFLGSTGGVKLNKPIVGVASTSTGQGYWLVATDGGIFAYGDATFLGSTGSMKLNQPIVGMAASTTGRGYRLVASDGGVFSYGDSPFFGSTGSMHLNQPIIGIASTPTNHGYWMVARDGGIFSFGDAPFLGAQVDQRGVVGITVTPKGGYQLSQSDGSLRVYNPEVPTAVEDVSSTTTSEPRLVVVPTTFAPPTSAPLSTSTTRPQVSTTKAPTTTTRAPTTTSTVMVTTSSTAVPVSTTKAPTTTSSSLPLGTTSTTKAPTTTSSSVVVTVPSGTTTSTSRPITTTSTTKPTIPTGTTSTTAKPTTTTTAKPTTTTTAKPTTTTTTTPPPVSGPVRYVSVGQSISSALNASAAGDTVILKNGTYGTQWISNVARPGVTVRGESRTGVTIQLLLRNTSGLRFENLTATNSSDSAYNVIDLTAGDSNLVFDRMTLLPKHFSGLSVGPGVDRVTLSNSTIDATGQVGAAATAGNGRGVHLFASSPFSLDTWPTNITITNNVIFGAGSDEINIGGARHVLISGNDIGAPQINADHNDGIQSYGSDDLAIVGNHIHSGGNTSGPDQGIILGHHPTVAALRVTNSVIENNIIEDWRSSAIVLTGTENTRVYNNTVVDNQGASLALASSPEPGLIVSMNIFDKFYNPDAVAVSTMANNCVRTGGQGSHLVTSDPLFDVTLPLYHLTSTSPCRNMVTSTGKQSVAVVATQDFSGKLRLDGAPDAGAWEY